MKKLVMLIGIISNLSLHAVDFRGEVSPVTSEIKSKMVYSWKEDSPIPLDDLRYVTVLHYDFDGAVKEGELVVHALIADDIVKIFEKLFEVKFPLTSMKLIDEFGAPQISDSDIDKNSMRANNTSAHYCRKVAGEERWSNHTWGLAIDVNPLINPFVKGEYVSPEEGKMNVDVRSADIPGMITTDSYIYEVFINHGFEWGGKCFPGYTDLHHFQKVIPGINKTQN